MVSAILKYKAAKSVPYIEQSKLAILLKIRSRLTAFFFGILEDGDLPPIIGTEIREQYPECFMDFNLTDNKQMYVTTLKVLNRRAKEKDFIQSFFAKSPTVYEDLKRLHAKHGHSSFVKSKTTLTAAKKWQPGFDGSLTQIIKRCKLCTHHADIIDTEVDRFNDVVQVETIDGAEDNSQLVKGKQSEPPFVDDTVKLTHSSTNRLKHLGVQAQEKKVETHKR
jgi:hypothetical protein